ncbi:MAG: histidine--tRNA ligase [Candidatus Margulisbacteria bacterium]|jgi:histidyl-tRNA synthetase|nr:histidine--tRNA ligase [Candidatus Margulisiibacteriota bacterium]
MKYAAPRGTRDILPADSPLWQLVENVCRHYFTLYNYREIRTPLFESTELFTRSIGDSTDIVKKEMYTFPDRKGRSLTLRPEATAAVVRAGLENNLITADSLTKLYYLGPMFRYERPQAGRQRQFHQAGAEVFGSSDPLLDAEVIKLCVDLFKALGLKELEVSLNSVGCRNCQPAYRTAVQQYFRQHAKALCADCQARLLTNPLRILDCKEGSCQSFIEKAPAALDHLDQECRAHFDKLVGWLDAWQVKYRVNSRLVRGLDYYTKTAFEVVSRQLGAQNALCGGGRYDNLVEELGGKPTPAIGFAIGLERLIEVMNKLNLERPAEGPELFIATIGDAARQVGVQLLAEARSKGVSADLDYLGKSLKAQLKAADRIKAAHVYIIGDEELKKKTGLLKNMATAEQKEVPFDQLLAQSDHSCGCGDDCRCE